MIRNWFVVPAAALSLILPAAMHAQRFPAPATYASISQDGWEVPPQEFNDIQRRGYHDGVQGAHKDFENHRNPDVNNRDEYRHPEGVSGHMRGAYRDAFRRGYQNGVSNLWGGPPTAAYAPGPMAPQGPPPRALPPSWDPNYRWDMGGIETDIARQGFHDGLDGAQKDYSNRRSPDVNNRDEYRKPNVPGEYRHDYRAGFRRGYEAAASRLWGVGPA